MRGEHVRGTRRRDGCRGSSPHARGAPLHQQRQTVVHGIIPACAGSTPPSTRYTARRPGSSPHARGAREGHAGGPPHRGIIPACAGSTQSRQCRRCEWWDHPRMRGEHGHGGVAGHAGQGSSPHARGARRVHDASEALPGIIPACAGSTIGAFSALRMPRDHPRIRGERCLCFRNAQCMQGSSPHTRGAPSQAAVRVRRRGIIPACAGSTRAWLRQACTRWDHPRMRGEHVREGEKPPENAGSSPPARGALLPPVTDSVGLGIIPAYAGSTRAG